MNRYTPEGSLIKTRENFEYISTPEGLIRAHEDGVILEAHATMCDHSLSLHVDLPSRMKAVIPRSECEMLRPGEISKDIAVLTRVGKAVCFKVIGFDAGPTGETVAILSRRAAQEECMERFISTLSPGDIIPAKVTHLESFGAFVDVGCGVVSLLSIDTISVSRISHPCARLSVGNRIHAVVKSTDDRGRVYVSTRELLGTWQENADCFSEGETVRGIVRSVESYGIFVELAPNLAGLAEYREGIYPGQTAAVYIKSIIPDKMKIKLIIIDALDESPTPTGLNYFLNPNEIDHIDSWSYSPPVCKKVIESIF